MKTAVQMYTLREEASKDFESVLKAVSSMGYQGVEFAGFYDIPSQDMKKLLNEYHLEAAAAHVNIGLLESDLAAIATYNQEIGNRNIVIPGLEMESLQQVQELVKHVTPIIQELNKRSFRVFYHNHNHELILEDNKYLLDAFFESFTPEQLECELDTYWIQRAGLNPSDYISRYAGRCSLLHFKDLPADMTNGEFAALGDGIMDWNTLLSDARKARAEWIIVENDQPKPNGLTTVERSIRFLKSIM